MTSQYQIILTCNACRATVKWNEEMNKFKCVNPNCNTNKTWKMKIKLKINKTDILYLLAISFGCLSIWISLYLYDPNKWILILPVTIWILSVDMYNQYKHALTLMEYYKNEMWNLKLNFSKEIINPKG